MNNDKKLIIEGVYECSAKERIGLNELFDAAVKVVIKDNTAIIRIDYTIFINIILN